MVNKERGRTSATTLGGDFYDNQNLWNGSSETISQVMNRQVPQPTCSRSKLVGELVYGFYSAAPVGDSEIRSDRAQQ